jgi:ribosome-binding factor A
MEIKTNSQRQEKVTELLRNLTAEFLQRESGIQSLITVTSATVSPDLKRATIYITVLPENKEDAALDFAKRKRKELREFVKAKTKFRVLPFLDVELDKAEKIRQKIDGLSN